MSEVIPPAQPQLQVAVAASTELALSAVNALRAECTLRWDATFVRMDMIEKNHERQHEDLVRVPTDVQKATTATRELLEEMMGRRIAELAHTKGRQIEAVHGEITTSIAKVHGQIVEAIANVSGEIIGQTKLSAEKFESLQKQLASIVETQRTYETATQTAIQTALAAADKTTAIAQSTADKAMAKAEAAADKQYLEAQIDALRQAMVAQLVSQKEAISAALNAAKEALTAAMIASERAIAKAEQANEKRFEAVNEFRATLADQQKTLVVRQEVDYRFTTFEKKLDENYERLNRSDLRMADYTPMETHNATVASLNDWRRQVDAQLTAASSKSSLAYAAIAVVIAVAGLLVTIFGVYTRGNNSSGGNSDVAASARAEIQRQVSALEARQLELLKSNAQLEELIRRPRPTIPP